MNDMLNDDDIIARLRSALDEVAAAGTAATGTACNTTTAALGRARFTDTPPR